MIDEYLDVPQLLDETIYLFLSEPAVRLRVAGVTESDIEETSQEIRKIERSLGKAADELDEAHGAEPETPSGEDGSIPGRSRGRRDVEPASNTRGGAQEIAAEDANSGSDGEGLDAGVVSEGSEVPESNLPALDLTKAEVPKVIDVASSETPPPASENVKSPGRSTSGQDPAKVDRIRETKQQLVRGHRGEKWVVEAERRRLEQLGLDPGRVRWIAQENETSPYDILSVNETGGDLFIEVKATNLSSAQTAFEMSEAEYQFAIKHSADYCLYRVTSVDSSEPAIHPYRDLSSLIESEKAISERSRLRIRLPEPIGDPISVQLRASRLADDS